eukprot:CAMPEP_0204328966 /NCGR_PEP_ID=MMETSP0469-20131031/13805_1 /ASSEMBLY_ACC=CAM_ASM_000384 /TAXON_ID=2969 /ORGANISM="Oxyrrhis marina" /LENGTH=629 /DNA_ID=CAMNT_0051311485 /DNA_START=17 /DNA_END=1906 /DNA_ORIENTATION=+
MGKEGFIFLPPALLVLGAILPSSLTGPVLDAARSATVQGLESALTKLRVVDDEDLSCGAATAHFEARLAALSSPAKVFFAELERDQPGEKLGFNVAARKDYLEVTSVSGAGPVGRWNAANPSKAIQQFDWITTVNGTQFNATKMKAALRNPGNLALQLMRSDAKDRQAAERRRLDKEILKGSKPAGLGVGIPEPKGSAVVVLHAENVERFIAANPLVMVMFYANWCGHCQQVAPDYTAAAAELGGMKFDVVPRLAKFDDGDSFNKGFGAGSPEKYNFTSYPTVKVFKNGRQEYYPFHVATNEVVTHMKSLALGQNPIEAHQNLLLETRPMLYRQFTTPDVVLDLEPETYNETVFDKGTNCLWVIFYYSDRCPFCRTLKPDYVKASTAVKEKLGDQVRFAAVNSRVFQDLAQRLGVTSFPWVTSVYAGAKVEDMAGLGGADSIINWATKMHGRVWKESPAWHDWAEGLCGSKPCKAEAAPERDQAGWDPEPTNTSRIWREIIGSHTWFFLHTVAAKYPEWPTQQDQQAMRYLVAGLGQHYPCKLCRAHLQQKLQSAGLGPVDTRDRQHLSKWFCRLHNRVNEDLGKKQVDCDIYRLDAKYLKDCGECSANPEEEPHAPAGWSAENYAAER